MATRSSRSENRQRTQRATVFPCPIRYCALRRYPSCRTSTFWTICDLLQIRIESDACDQIGDTMAPPLLSAIYFQAQHPAWHGPMSANEDRCNQLQLDARHFPTEGECETHCPHEHAIRTGGARRERTRTVALHAALPSSSWTEIRT